MPFLLALKKNPARQSVFLCWGIKLLKFCSKSCWKEQLFMFCLFGESLCSNICTLQYATMEFIELIWLWKHIKKVRSSQPSISLSSSTELSKTQFLPLSIVEVIKRYTFHYLMKSAHISGNQNCFETIQWFNRWRYPRLVISLFSFVETLI